VAIGAKAPAKGAIRADGVNAVAAGVEGPIGAHRRTGIDVAATRHRAKADVDRAGPDLKPPLGFSGGRIDGVEVVIVRAHHQKRVGAEHAEQRGRAEDGIARREGPTRRSVSLEHVEMGVVRADGDRASRQWQWRAAHRAARQK